MFDYPIAKVIPMRDCPKRIYKRYGLKVIVYELENIKNGVKFEYDIGDKLFEINFDKKKNIDIFMNDLFYGENDGH